MYCKGKTIFIFVLSYFPFTHRPSLFQTVYLSLYSTTQVYSSDAEDLPLRLKSGSMAAALKIRLIDMVQWRTLMSAVPIFGFQEYGTFLE
jgi:hypothetical protein